MIHVFTDCKIKSKRSVFLRVSLTNLEPTSFTIYENHNFNEHIHIQTSLNFLWFCIKLAFSNSAFLIHIFMNTFLVFLIFEKLNDLTSARAAYKLRCLSFYLHLNFFCHRWYHISIFRWKNRCSNTAGIIIQFETQGRINSNYLQQTIHAFYIFLQKNNRKIHHIRKHFSVLSNLRKKLQN